MLTDVLIRSVLFGVAMLSFMVGIFLTVEATLVQDSIMPLEKIIAVILFYGNGAYCSYLTFKS